MADPIQSLHQEPGRPLADLLAAAARGDGPAWRDLIDRYSPRIFALARSRCRSADAAEEVTQSVFATVAAKLGGQTGGAYTEMGRFEPWLFRIAMNRVRDEARRRDRQAPATDPADLAALADPGIDLSGRAATADLDRLRSALELLPPIDREVIDLRHHGGLSFRQIADLVDEPIGTLLARHHRALRKLRALLTPDGGSSEP